MLKIIIKNQNLIKIYKISVKIFTFLNKYLFLMSILSILINFYKTLRENKFFRFISYIIKFILLFNIILGTGIILYFGDISNPLLGFNIYYDIIQPYIDFIKNLWNKLINLNLDDKLVSEIKNNIDIKQEIREGVKQGIKEAVGEVLTELKENELENNVNSDLLKYSAIVGSVLFFGYFLFYLPGPSIDPQDLTQYNFFNQSLIEFKITVKDLVVNFFSKPSNPGVGPAGDNQLIAPQISPTNSDCSSVTPEKEFNRYFSSGSDTSTVTPNTPTNSNTNLN